MKNSLNLRLLVSASIVLALFFAVAGIVLERSFRKGAEQALRERLQVHIYALLSAAELNDSGEMTVARTLHEARFSNPGSGLYGYIQSAKKHVLWRSQSSLGEVIQPATDIRPGQKIFIRDEAGRFVLHYGVVWETEAGREREYVFTIVEDDDSFLRQVSGFANTLWFWLGSIGFLLVVLQFIILRWSLKPLRKIARDLEAIEAGDKSCLDDHYPSELQGLAGNLNALLTSERAHLERYRNTLADLAHSLKTPLAILRGCLETGEVASDLRATLQEQISRMDEIIGYQLQRAAARGQKRLSHSINLLSIIHKITAALDKVYAAKGINAVVHAGESGKFFCEEGDIYEIAGNLIDNAYKWCQSRVDVRIDLITDDSKKHSALRLVVEDDGPGIPLEKVEQILRRGIRADEKTHGHGIGMAVVNELVQLLGGKLKAGKSAYGGARWEVLLPASI
ncbi:MAG: ATP-binding protein [Pseudomonadota bacterium]